MIRSRGFLTILLVLTTVVGISKDALALSATEVISSIPRQFTGCFQWHGTTDVQRVQMAFTQVKAMSGDKVLVTGEGIYDSGSVFRINVRIEIDPGSLRLELRESEPQLVSGSGVYITQGTYRGSISEDLLHIQAKWRTDGTDDTGELALDAGSDPSRPCALDGIPS